MHVLYLQHLNSAQALRSFLIPLLNTKLPSAFFSPLQVFLPFEGQIPFQCCLFSALVGEKFSMFCVHSFFLHTPRSILGRQSDSVKRALDGLRSRKQVLDTVLAVTSLLTFTCHVIYLCLIFVIILSFVYLVLSSIASWSNFTQKILN